MFNHRKRFLVTTALVLAAAISVRAQDPYKDLIKYDFGQSRTQLVAIEDEIRKASPAQYAAIEGKLLAVLATPDATMAAKQFVCRQLRQIGSEKCIAPVAVLLTDEKLSHMARYALQNLPFPAVDDAFRAALDKVTGNLKIGVVGSIAQRGDAKAVPQLAAVINNPDKALAAAALGALGRIGGPAAAQALAQAQVPAELKLKRDDAYLMCADKMEPAAAAKIYRELFVKTNPSVVRIGALRGIMATGKEEAVPTLIEMLSDGDPKVQAAAGRFLVDVPGAAATQAIVQKVGGLAPEQQAIVVNALADRGDKAATAEVTKLTSSGSQAARVAALKALGVLGDASSVELLLKAAVGNDDAAAAAAESLNKVKGADVDAALVKHLQSADAATKAVLVKALTARNEVGAVPALLKEAEGAQPPLRGEIFKALGAMVDAKNLPGLVALLVKTEGSGEAEGALTDSCRRIEPARMEGPVMSALSSASVPVKCAALRVLGQVGSAKALEAVRGAMNDSNADVQDAAIRSLSNWTDASAEPDLLAIAKSGKTEKHRILALRGFVNLVRREGKANPKDAIKKLNDGMAAAARPDEKKLVIGALAELGSAEAFKALTPYLNDEALKAEAQSAYLKTADSLKQKHKKEAIEGLKKFVQAVTTGAQFERAKKMLAELGSK